MGSYHLKATKDEQLEQLQNKIQLLKQKTLQVTMKTQI